MHSQEHHGNKRRNIIAISRIAVVVLLLICAGLFYQSIRAHSSDKIVADAVANALSARTYSTKFTVTSETGGITHKSQFEGSGGYVEGFKGSVKTSYSSKDSTAPLESNLNVLQDASGNTFVKFNNVNNFQKMLRNQFQAIVKDKDIPQETIDQKKEEFNKQLDALAKNAKDKWVNTEPAGVQNMVGQAPHEETCAKKKPTIDTQKKNRKELVDAYGQNTFFTIKKDLGTRDGDRGFLVATDSKIVGEFMKALQSTAIFKRFSQCGLGGVSVLDKLLSTILQSGQQNSQAGSVRTEFWINPDTNSLDRIVATVKITDGQQQSTMKLEAAMKYDVAVDIETPKDTISYEKAIPLLVANGDSSSPQDF